ncbi:MAG: hypothetical protein WKG07_33795 [Hymenobacter sp.]
MKPWGVRSTMVNAADVNKPRQLTEEEARTWVGIDFGRVEEERQSVCSLGVGFAVNGPVILLGNPADNPLIATVERMGFLPYKTSAGSARRGRGYPRPAARCSGHRTSPLPSSPSTRRVWPRQSERCGRSGGGLIPTPLGLPFTASNNSGQTSSEDTREAAIVRRAILPDRPLSMNAMPNGQVAVLANDGTTTTLDATGKIVRQKAGSKADATPRKPPRRAGGAESRLVTTGSPSRLPPPRDHRHRLPGRHRSGLMQGAKKNRASAVAGHQRIIWAGNKLVAGLADGQLV